MKSKDFRPAAPVLGFLLVLLLACNLALPRPQAATQPPTAALASPPPAAAPSSTSVVVDEVPVTPSSTATAPVVHQVKPADLAVVGQLVYDVESEGTAADHRAPYGDSYDINRLERPFLQDMTYVPSLDISTYMLGQDSDWFYVTITLVGADPNDPKGIDYGVELDTDHDGFGDFLLWAHPPYTDQWDTAPVQIFEDTNRDTGGRSGEKSDAPLTGDGYDKLIFNGGSGDADPDIAWVRANAGRKGLVQFAFKRSWAGGTFMLGVLADAGLKAPTQMDYVDRFLPSQAGSPVRDNKNYPLKALYAVDNVCRQAFGFKPTGYEPQLCPREAPPATKQPKATPGTTPSG